jgi:mono/diheme cytochrome c family protein
MRGKLLAISLLLLAVASVSLPLSGCKKAAAVATADNTPSAYDTEPDWNDSTKLINLGYQEAQGKRLFYQYCVWCHADATPAGPSNRSNLTPVPPLMNDGEKLNGESDESLQKIIILGGSAVGKSAMMPPYGKTLNAGDIMALVTFARAIAQPAYQPSPQAAAPNAPKP